MSLRYLVKYMTIYHYAMNPNDDALCLDCKKGYELAYPVDVCFNRRDGQYMKASCDRMELYNDAACTELAGTADFDGQCHYGDQWKCREVEASTIVLRNEYYLQGGEECGNLKNTYFGELGTCNYRGDGQSEQYTLDSGTIEYKVFPNDDCEGTPSTLLYGDLKGNQCVANGGVGLTFEYFPRDTFPPLNVTLPPPPVDNLPEGVPPPQVNPPVDNLPEGVPPPQVNPPVDNLPAMVAPTENQPEPESITLYLQKKAKEEVDAENQDESITLYLQQKTKEEGEKPLVNPPRMYLAEKTKAEVADPFIPVGAVPDQPEEEKFLRQKLRDALAH